MKGMILAAGFGTRLRPATFEIPKPLIPLANRPLIGWVLEAMLQAGVREVVVNLHHLPLPLEQWLTSTHGDRCAFVFSREEEILGTGGGIRRVRKALEGEPFVLANGDTVQSPPFERLVAALDAESAVAAMLLRHPPAHDRFTEVFFDGRFVTGFGSGTGEPLMFAGAHAFSPEIFDRLPDTEVSGITEDVYLPMTRRGEKTLAGVVHDGMWFDIGTPARYLEATSAVLATIREGSLPATPGSRLMSDSLVAADAAAEGEIASSVLGEGAVVRGGGVVSRSVLWEGAVVDRDSKVEGSILGRGVVLPRGARVRNALVCRRLEGVDYPEGTLVIGDWVAAPVVEGDVKLEGF